MVGSVASGWEWSIGFGNLVFGWKYSVWLGCWLAGWLAGRLVGWLVGWLAGWLASWLLGWLPGWLAGRLAGWPYLGWTWSQGGPGACWTAPPPQGVPPKATKHYKKLGIVGMFGW